MTDTTEDAELITERRQVYGDPEETFIRIAQVFTGILGHEVKPYDVPLLMAGMKLVRTQVCPDYSDNSDDIDGYLDIFRLLVGEDMVDARSVTEYLRIKHEREKMSAQSTTHFTVTTDGDIKQNVPMKPLPHEHKTMEGSNSCWCGAYYGPLTHVWHEWNQSIPQQQQQPYVSDKEMASTIPEPETHEPPAPGAAARVPLHTCYYPNGATVCWCGQKKSEAD